jgi:hypothetical protein
MALRSLFRFAKRRGLTFADPTRHLSSGRGAGRTVLPMTAEQIRAAGQAAVTSAQRLAIAPAAGHAARPKATGRHAADPARRHGPARRHDPACAAARPSGSVGSPVGSAGCPGGAGTSRLIRSPGCRVSEGLASR